jgi:hypothetical protein
MYPGLPESLRDDLRTHHSIRITLTVLDTEMNPVGAPLTNALLDGSVNVDLGGEVTRSCTLTLYDPDEQLDFDSNSPADGALYADRMMRVHYGVRVPGGSWVDVPVFTGPVVKFSRDGMKVNVECQGKEALAMGNAMRVETYKKNARIVDVIEDVMRNEGERNFAFISKAGRLSGDVALVHETVPWAFARQRAASLGCHLYYDGNGRLRLREYPGTATWTFTEGTGGDILTPPVVEFSIDGVRNAVRVTGKKPKGKGKNADDGKEKKIVVTVVADSTHPLSPARLGRNGQGRYLVDFFEDDHIGSEAEARRVGKQRLASLLQSFIDVKFDSLVIPHLDAGDIIGVKTSRFSMTARLNAFSIPLTAGGAMSVGYNRRMKAPNRKAIR